MRGWAPGLADDWRLLPGLLLLTVASAASDPIRAQETPAGGIEPQEAPRACLERLLETGADDLTLGEMRRRCATPRAATAGAATESETVTGETATEDLPAGPVQERYSRQGKPEPNPFTLLAHRPNYLLAGAWNQRGWDPTLFQEAENNPDYLLDDVEIQFQFSVKVPLTLNLLDGRMDLYAAYTNRSFWQAYNADLSRPFRETNHEPELWAEFDSDLRVFGLTNVLNRVGLVHQSNGQSDPLSRSWDRLYAELLFERGRWAIGVKPWLILDDEENPDIDDYMGYGELRVAWSPANQRHVVSVMLRNQIESGFDRGAVELGWSFPVFDYPWVKGYLQYFYGYGESLIDYDRRVNRIGIGMAFSDWLD